MKRVLKALPALSLAVVFVACSEGKKLNDMHDATLEMNDTTKQLAKTSDDMKATTQSVNTVSTQMNQKMDKMTTTTDKLAQVTERVGQVTETVGAATVEVKHATEELTDMNRQGGSLGLRRSALKELRAATSAGMKVAQAAQYYEAFEFQLWNNQGQDAAPGKRDSLMKDAVTEFFEVIDEFDTGGETATSDSFFYPDTNKKDAGFNALAAALHIVNRKQSEMNQKYPQFPVVSMLTLLQDAMLKEKDLAAGKIAASDLSATETEILAHRKTVVRLLQARHNFIGMIVLAKVSPVLDGNVSAMRAYYFGWNMDLDKHTEIELGRYTRYLRGLLATQKFLVSVGIKPVVDSWMGGLMSNPTPKTAGKGTGAINAARTEFLVALRDAQKNLEAISKMK